ncbi:MAG TPA: hypothetical protein VFB50_22865 [Chloroflexota bacterium]|nr:hypothetical protein [Chloroflexota bacterium]
MPPDQDEVLHLGPNNDLERMLKQIEELLETRIVCLVVTNPRGEVGVLCPSTHRQYLRELQHVNWSELSEQAGD